MEIGKGLPTPLPVWRGKSLPLKGIKKVLVRGANWIGDAVMTLPALQALRRAFSEGHITVLAKPWVADVYRLSHLADEVFIYEDPGPHEGIGGLMKLCAHLQEEGFEAAILFQNAMEAAIIAFLARIPIRAGYDTDGRLFLLTHAVRRKKSVHRLHQVHYYLEMIRALGVAVADHTPRIVPPGNIPFPLPEGNLIGMAPGAQYGPAKRWFPERFAALADLLSASLSAQVLLFGSKADKEVTAEIKSLSQHPPIDLAGKTSLTEAMAIMARLRAFVTNDSGLMHVAAALGIPVVALFGSTNPEATGPVGSASRVIYHPVPCSPCLKASCPSDFRCMESIHVEEVFSAVKELWEEKR